MANFSCVTDCIDCIESGLIRSAVAEEFGKHHVSMEEHQYTFEWNDKKHTIPILAREELDHDCPSSSK